MPISTMPTGSPAIHGLEPVAVTLAFLIVPLAIESLLNGTVLRRGQRVRPGRRRSDGRDHLRPSTSRSASCWALAGALLPACAGPRICSGRCRSMPALIVLILLFNLAVGHYRELLIADPDAASHRVLPRLVAEPFGDPGSEIARAGADRLHHRLLRRRARAIRPSAPIPARLRPTDAGGSAATRSRPSGAGSTPT